MRTAYVGQDARKYISGFWQTVKEEVCLADPERVLQVEALARVLGFERLLHRHPLTLSTGETSKIVLAGYILSAVNVLICDGIVETFDRATRAALWAHFSELLGGRQVVLLDIVAAPVFARLWDLDKGIVAPTGEALSAGYSELGSDAAGLVTSASRIRFKDATPVVTVDHVSIRRGDALVLADLSVAVRPGECLWLNGPNGCGKTTMMEAIVGWLPVSEGTIAVCGQHAPTARRHYLAFAPPDAESTITEESLIDEIMSTLGPPCARERAAGWLASAGIPERLWHARLSESATLRKLTSVLTALAGGRPVCLLDEPTLLLGYAERSWLVSSMVKYLQDGGAIICAGHDETLRREIELEGSRS